MTTDELQAGRTADAPSELGATGWKAAATRVVAELKRDHVSLLAAGVAFKALLALFPALLAAVSIWGLVASPEQMTQQLSGLLGALPDDASQILEDQLTTIAEGATGTLTFALAVSLAVALWSASGGVAGLIEGCNAAYNEVDERSFPIKRGLALLLTFGAIVFLAVALGLIAVLPAVLGQLGLGPTAELIVQVVQWPILGVLLILALAVVYKFGPDRDRPRLGWVTWGAAIATVLWLVGSGAFTLYVNNFGNFNETYGAFAGLIILLLWLMLSAFVVLLGAEINAEVERQTARDTTEGQPQPLGQRGAVVADTTPEHYRDEHEQG
jgi:membrane protein